MKATQILNSALPWRQKPHLFFLKSSLSQKQGNNLTTKMYRNFDTSQKGFFKNNCQSSTKFIQLDRCLPMLAYVKQFGVCIPPEFKDTF